MRSIRKSQRPSRLIGALAESPKLFRPFGGGGKIGPHLLSRAAVDHLVANRYTCVLWNCVPEDWIDQDAWVDRALADASRQAHTLVVMHDILPRAMSHLDRFIGALGGRGASHHARVSGRVHPDRGRGARARYFGIRAR